MYSRRIHRTMNRLCGSLLVLLAASAAAPTRVDLQASWRPLPRNQGESGLVGTEPWLALNKFPSHLQPADRNPGAALLASGNEWLRQRLLETCPGH
jgi:hypothetical protein